MRKSISIMVASLMLVASMGLASCSKEGGGGWSGSGSDGGGSSAPTSLVGTTWKFTYSGSSRQEGGGLRFTTSSNVQIIDWEYENGQYVEDTDPATYTYTAPNGFVYSGGITASFTVYGSSMNFNMPGEGTVVLTRQ